MNDHMGDAHERIAIKGNRFVQYGCALVGILALLASGCFYWAGSILDMGFLYFFSVLFGLLAVWLLVTFFKIKNQFMILSDEQTLHLLVWGKFISVPYQFIDNVALRGAWGLGYGYRRWLTIELDEKFSPFSHPLENFFFQLLGSQIIYGGAALETSIDKAYFKISTLVSAKKFNDQDRDNTQYSF